MRLEEIYTKGNYPEQTDRQRVAFNNFICNAPVGHVMILHKAAIDGGFLVNGRSSFHPIKFPAEILGFQVELAP